MLAKLFVGKEIKNALKHRFRLPMWKQMTKVLIFLKKMQVLLDAALIWLTNFGPMSAKKSLNLFLFYHWLP